MHTCLTLTLGVLLCTSSTVARAAAPGGESSEAAPREVRVDALPGGPLRLSFEPLPPAQALEPLRPEEVREVLAALKELSRPREGFEPGVTMASVGPQDIPGQWEHHLREAFASRYGPPLLPLPPSLETSRLFMALKLAPRYMGKGMSEAARELFSSRLFLASVALSVLVYFAAWVAPEPLFTKTFAAALTLRLSLAVGVLELTRVALACVRLYREVEAATTLEQLEAVAERFGKALGGTGLRVLVMVASMGMARGLPQVPQGGLTGLLGSPRYALPGGLSLEGATTVRMVADGTVLVTGVAAGTVAA
ncbi:hypothetical protein DAT35_57890, partial [Vitiosangium sp. GDMCC 1.1324]